MSRAVTLIPLMILFGLTYVFASGLQRDPSIVQSVLIDKPLPVFQLPVFGADGKQFASGEMKGRVHLINIFASWCVACRVEHPLLLELAQGKRVPVVGLAWKDKPEDLKIWLQELGNPYSVIADDREGRIAIELGVTGAPETFVIDRKMRIRYKHIGPIDAHIWKETLEPMIANLEKEP